MGRSRVQLGNTQRQARRRKVPLAKEPAVLQPEAEAGGGGTREDRLADSHPLAPARVLELQAVVVSVSVSVSVSV